jgi:hypothetical protein
MNEEWKTVDDLGGRYEVSNLGNIRSIGYIDGSGKFRKPRYLKCSYSKHLKYKVFSTAYMGKNMLRYVHRLVALAFIPKPDGRYEVNHIDGDKANCKLSNLEWVTSRENSQHAFRMGLIKTLTGESGEGCPASKLNNEKVAEIKSMLRNGEKLCHIAKRYGVVTGTIAWIRDGVTWADVE